MTAAAPIILRPHYASASIADALRDVVEVAAYGRHASGKFREARFVRIRTDKTFEVKP